MNQLYIKNHITMVALYPTPEPHKHLALHLILATQGNLECEIENKKIFAPAIMIAADVEHTVTVNNGKTIVFLFDATSIQGQNIQHLYLKESSYFILPQEDVERLLDIYHEANDLKIFDQKVCEYLQLWKRQEYTMDKRIHDLLETLSKMDCLPDNVFEYACETTHLSKSRFSHLFKENTGMSFRQYLVMLKLQIAYNGYESGKSITDIAMDSGFDSPSHFANTMHQMFGLKASDFRNTMYE